MEMNKITIFFLLFFSILYAQDEEYTIDQKYLEDNPYLGIENLSAYLSGNHAKSNFNEALTKSSAKYNKDVYPIPDDTYIIKVRYYKTKKNFYFFLSQHSRYALNYQVLPAKEIVTIL